MQQPSALVEDIDSTLLLLQDASIASQPVTFLQSADSMIPRLIEETKMSRALFGVFHSSYRMGRYGCSYGRDPRGNTSVL
jgi:hypothetical protein